MGGEVFLRSFLYYCGLGVITTLIWDDFDLRPFAPPFILIAIAVAEPIDQIRFFTTIAPAFAGLLGLMIWLHHRFESLAEPSLSAVCL